MSARPAVPLLRYWLLSVFVAIALAGAVNLMLIHFFWPHPAVLLQIALGAAAWFGVWHFMEPWAVRRSR